NLFELHVVMFIDPCGITYLAYPLIEKASIQGERRNQSLGSDLGDETIARSEGEQISSKEQAHSSCDDDDISLVLLERGLAYGFWLGMVFEHFGVPVGEWHIQTIKDVLGVVDHETIPATKREANAPMQRLRASLTAKNEEIIALQGSHSAAIDKLHIDYGLKHARLAEENSRLKEELAQTQAALNTERLSNFDRLKHLYELLTKDFPSLSSALLPSV
ncbi:hypothetical protein H5410_025299, partial [Solanum commersonii]